MLNYRNDDITFCLNGEYVNLENLAEYLLEQKNIFSRYEDEIAKLEEQSFLQQKKEPEEPRMQNITSFETDGKEKAHIAEVTCMDLPLDFENAFADDERAKLHCDSAADGLIASLNNLGCVDLEYISSVTGMEIRDIIYALKGAVYQNPQTWGECFYKGWELSDSYLSGNIVTKLKLAVSANEKYCGYFEENVKALRKCLPKNVSTDEIYITLSSPWVPPQTIDEFIEYLYKEKQPAYFAGYCTTKHDELTGLWEIPKKTRYKNGRTAVIDRVTYGTDKLSCLNLLEQALNQRTPRVYKISGVLDEHETLLACEKQQLIIDTFREWVWKDADRAEMLKSIYREKYLAIRQRHFDGSFLTFPGLNPDIRLYDYQKNAVARILFSDNTLLAHSVGSGKSFIMICAAHELKRIGKAKKNLFVLPNNTVGQFRDMFLKLYPSSRLLVIEPKDFTKAKRNSVLKKIAEEDFDAVLMASSSFDLLPLSEKYYRDYFEKQRDELARAKENFHSDAPIERRIKSLNTALEKIRKSMKNTDFEYFFDQLGIDRLWVDESQGYKALPLHTKTEGGMGISMAGAEKCRKMLNKVRCVQEKNGGGGVVFASATPIVNSVADLYTTMYYLQYGTLKLLGLGTFDAWLGAFSEKENVFELDVDSNSYILKTKYKKFHNLTELTSILAGIADFHEMDPSCDAELPKFSGYTDISVETTPAFRRYLSSISKRADDIRSHRVSNKEDNLLKLSTDGRKAAADLRLIDPKLYKGYVTGNKVCACADNVFRIYKETEDKKSTQLVFCDLSVPGSASKKRGFNLYDELKSVLAAKGVKKNEIAFVHDFDTEKLREELYEKFRRGEIRILIGSTYKMSQGLNIQDLLIAVHWLTIPWICSSYTQGNGRALRQGNTNKEVFIYRYVQKSSFDGYSYQILESKARFISQLLSGSLLDREKEDVDDTVLSFAEIKALAVGNPKIKQRCELINKIDRLRILQREYVEKRIALKTELESIPGRVEAKMKMIENCRQDKAFYEKNKADIPSDELKEIKGRIAKAVFLCTDRPSETYICDYQGFKLFIPPYMNSAKQQIILRGKNSYRIEYKTEKGITVKLNNFLETLDDEIGLYEEAAEGLKIRASAIKEELSKEGGNEAEIIKLRDELSQLDKELNLKEA